MKKTLLCRGFSLFGGPEGSRTPDLLNAIQALSQLSYGPMFSQRQLLVYRAGADLSRKTFGFPGLTAQSLLWEEGMTQKPARRLFVLFHLGDQRGGGRKSPFLPDKGQKLYGHGFAV